MYKYRFEDFKTAFKAYKIAIKILPKSLAFVTNENIEDSKSFFLIVHNYD